MLLRHNFNCKKPASPGEISGSRLGARCILDEPKKPVVSESREPEQHEEAPTGQRRKLSINRDYNRNRLKYTRKNYLVLPLEDVILKTTS